MVHILVVAVRYHTISLEVVNHRHVVIVIVYFGDFISRLMAIR